MTDAVVPARTAAAAHRARRRRDPDWLRNQLPMGMLEDEFLHRFLGIFQELADSYLQHIDNLEHAFDPAVAPMPLVRTMAAWIGAGIADDPMPEVEQRRLLQAASRHLAMRGTRVGLQALLEILAEPPVTIEDSGGVYLEGEAPQASPHVVVRTSGFGYTEPADLLELVRLELPASATFELHVGDRTLWPVTVRTSDSRGVDAGIQEAS